MTLAKSSLDIAAWYLELVDDPSLFEQIAAGARANGRRGPRDRGSARAARPPSGRAALGASAQPVRRPDERVQVELLRRYRAGDETALAPLLRSVAGIRRRPPQHGLTGRAQLWLRGGCRGAGDVVEPAGDSGRPRVRISSRPIVYSVSSLLERARATHAFERLRVGGDAAHSSAITSETSR